METIVMYLMTHWQPLLGGCVGAAILAFVGYMNWYGTVKADTARWIGRNILRDTVTSEASGNGAFMVFTSILLAIGWIWTGLALMYLWNG